MGNFKSELSNYQNVPRELVFDKDLSDRARFVYVFMACKPNDWDFYLEPMAKDIGYSVDTLRKYINELVTSGWLIKGEQTNENGVFGAVEYTLKATKISDTEFFRHGNNQPQINKDIKEIKTETTKEKSNTIILDKKKKIEDAQNDFYNSLVPYVSVYGKEMIRAFYDYWTEPNKSKTKMRFQMERTWDLERRLARWEKNNKLNNNYGRETITDKIRRTVEEANMFSEQLRSRIGEQTDVCDGDNTEVW